MRSRAESGLVALWAGTAVFVLSSLVEAAPDACSRSGTLASCTGNQSGGVTDGTDFPTADTIARVRLEGLTQDITPPSGVEAVEFSVYGDNRGKASDAHWRYLYDDVTGLPYWVVWDDADDGSEGGKKDAVTIEVDAPSTRLTTRNATALYALNKGGKGGDGGDGDGKDFGKLLGGLFKSEGGDGGKGGGGNGASVDANTQIETSGNWAYGILAYSIGGDGGRGGTVDFSFDADAGDGGVGGNGGAASVTQRGAIVTHDYAAHGILAVSEAGNGGRGGNGGGADARGGNGGAGGSGGTVAVDNLGSIETHGKDAIGIYGRSLGGKGGNGGSAGGIYAAAGGGAGSGDGGDVSLSNNGRVTTHGDFARGIAASTVGGQGGSGGGSGGVVGVGGSGARNNGDGGLAKVDNRGTVITYGTRSTGLFAQSLGGGGGLAGSTGGVVGLGGGAGDAGNGGTAWIISNGSVSTQGGDAIGLWAQSIGGGGGDGGASGGVYSVGGTGGNSGQGGRVDVDLLAANHITTKGYKAFGVLAQSIGGGGGDGAASGGVVSVGGGGGASGNGGAVEVLAAGSVTTEGGMSTAVLAQSLGGGGGNGAGSGGAYSVGGRGGAGGSGGTVKVELADGVVLDTSGALARGVLAQSIGRGGGNGAGSGGLVSIGGSGSGGGNGASVEISHLGTRATIRTRGDDAAAVLAQSLGGGGGNGAGSGGGVSIGGSGSGGGNGGTVTVSLGDAIDLDTQGDHARGILAQSIGRGGGNGAGSGGLVSIGGKGDGGGDGGAVTVSVAGGTVDTTGYDAVAILAQSLGGGGGNGAGSGGLVSIGGDGSGGGDGAAVSVTNHAALGTWGNLARGILAQSIGDGGGNGAGSGGLVSIGGEGAGAGAGGAVSLFNHGAIVTRGQQANAILAQSLGGGGGNGAGSGGLVSIGGSGSGGGSGGAVQVTNTDLLQVSGSMASAILAQSIGGGGGNGAGSGGVVSVGGSSSGNSTGGPVSVSNSGNIVASGNRTRGIHAQSIGGGGGNGAGSGGLVSVGGSGAGGANAGAVSATNHGAIGTNGAHAHGIDVLSLGGGGGDGAGSGGGISIGGYGNSGGDGGAAHVSNDGAIATLGEWSRGISARSSGGGGGAGMGSGGVLAIGGAGAGAGDGGIVSLINSAAVNTIGDHSAGLFAKSLGGGGGDGGESGSISAFGSFNLGGSAGGGGHGGDVSVDHGGGATVATLGNYSSAIVADSTGGGGGDGGFSLSMAAGVNFAGSLAIGGSGGAGGDGGMVAVDAQGNLVTAGEHSHGIRAVSHGGGGGSGGFAASMALSVGDTAPAGALAVAIGGSGGSGGDAGRIEVDYDGLVSTAGDFARGITAGSIGGGGGEGGLSVGVSGAFSPLAPSYSGTLAIGGSGGSGGDGATVSLVVGQRSHTLISTAGTGAAGIVATSDGGGGGNGNLSVGVTAGGTTILSEGAALSVSVGGAGGEGGNAAAVVVDNAAAVKTLGDYSLGLGAFSTGGGGGTGLTAFSGNLTHNVKYNGTVSVGGSGGKGGRSDGVTLDNKGFVHTTGYSSPGLFAQSLGGGGGWAGHAFGGILSIGSSPISPNINAGVSVGGSGGDGGSAAAVTVTSHDSIWTHGSESQGIVAQSIGGGGGRGGNAFAGLVDFSTADKAVAAPTVNVGVSVGGSGGAGGAGGNVTVSHLVGEILTGLAPPPDTLALLGDSLADELSVGAGAHGILARSVGGGGGDGGGAGSLSLLVGGKAGIPILVKKPEPDFKATVTVGGTGGASGDGGQVLVINQDRIETRGKAAYGIDAQSIGGGGGSGGNAMMGMPFAPQWVGVLVAGGNFLFSSNAIYQDLNVTVGGSAGATGSGGGVTVTNGGRIATQGTGAYGIFAQSVGGGGGEGGNATGGALTSVVTVGGSAGAAGNGGLVSVTNSNSITTRGAGASAIFAQSIGGGGGTGGNANTGLLGVLSIGGRSGAGGDGGNVVVSNLAGARIETWGDGAMGIVAQSVGGGGGMAGNVQNTLIPDVVNLGIGLRVLGNGGAGGGGGDVTVLSDGDIVTHGKGAHGIYVQSVGGGGGAVGNLGQGVDQFLTFLTGSAGDAGSGGDITITHTGNITTYGEAAHGVFVQSAGGQGNGGRLKITFDGSFMAYGKDSTAVMVQSIGDFSGANVSITLPVGGAFVGGTGDSSGLRLLDGQDNTFENHGEVRTLHGVDGWAIRAGRGNDVIDNYGRIIGSVDLSGGTDAINNRTGAFFAPGSQILLGPHQALTNEGRFSPGDRGRVQTTTMGSDYVQHATGTFELDLDFARSGVGDEVDRFVAHGTAEVHGRIDLGLSNTGRVPSGSRQAIFLSALDGVVDHSGLVLDAPASLILSFALEYPNANDIQLQYGADFTPEGVDLNANQTAVGEHINDIQLAGGTATFAPIVEQLVALTDPGRLAEAYSRLSPEPYAASLSQALFSGQRFSGQLLSCRQRDGRYRFLREGECRWLRVDRSFYDQETTGSNMGMQRRGTAVSGGFQRLVGDGEVMGYGLSLQEGSYRFDDFAHARGRTVQLGVVRKRQRGQDLVSGSLVAGYSRLTARRVVNLPAPGVTARSTPDLFFLAGHVRLNRLLEIRGAYAKPLLDLGLGWVHAKGFSESGAGGANLAMEATDHVVGSIQPAIELGGEVVLGRHTLARPHLRVGATRYLNTSLEAVGRMQGAPPGVVPFTVRSDIDRTYIDVDAGIDVLSKDGRVLSIFGSYRASDQSHEGGFGLKLAIPFD